MGRLRAISVGDCCIDWYSGEGERAYVGGNAANTAVYLARQGVDTWFMGIVGDDAAGEYVRSALAEEGVHLDYLSVRKGKTGICEIRVQGGERLFVSEDLGVSSPFVLSEEDLEAIAGFDLAHIPGFFSWGGSARVNQPALGDELGSLAGKVKLSVDFSEFTEGEDYFKKLGRFVDFSFFSRPGLSTEEIDKLIRQFLRFTHGLVIVTCGERGSYAAAKDGVIHYCPAEDVDVADTLGAGDSFIGGFLASYLQKGDVAQALRSGTRVAAGVIQQEGGWSNCIIERFYRSIKFTRTN
ncbi:MAG: hypothetical protein DRQ24_08150 [Candidatus Latescibacterota bacterium]|nr:MAG: hypothetical protein DRQ24_08150 [Candidatus Latescibacterota bacterium]